jgi:hypothetical protein
LSKPELGIPQENTYSLLNIDSWTDGYASEVGLQANKHFFDQKELQRTTNSIRSGALNEILMQKPKSLKWQIINTSAQNNPTANSQQPTANTLIETPKAEVKWQSSNILNKSSWTDIAAPFSSLFGTIDEAISVIKGVNVDVFKKYQNNLPAGIAIELPSTTCWENGIQPTGPSTSYACVKEATVAEKVEVHISNKSKEKIVKKSFNSEADYFAFSKKTYDLMKNMDRVSSQKFKSNLTLNPRVNESYFVNLNSNLVESVHKAQIKFDGEIEKQMQLAKGDGVLVDPQLYQSLDKRKGFNNRPTANAMRQWAMYSGVETWEKTINWNFVQVNALDPTKIKISTPWSAPQAGFVKTTEAGSPFRLFYGAALAKDAFDRIGDACQRAGGMDGFLADPKKWLEAVGVNKNGRTDHISDEVIDLVRGTHHMMRSFGLDKITWDQMNKFFKDFENSKIGKISSGKFGGTLCLAFDASRASESFSTAHTLFKHRDCKIDIENSSFRNGLYHVFDGVAWSSCFRADLAFMRTSPTSSIALAEKAMAQGNIGPYSQFAKRIYAVQEAAFMCSNVAKYYTSKAANEPVADQMNRSNWLHVSTINTAAAVFSLKSAFGVALVDWYVKSKSPGPIHVSNTLISRGLDPNEFINTLNLYNPGGINALSHWWTEKGIFDGLEVRFGPNSSATPIEKQDYQNFKAKSAVYHEALMNAKAQEVALVLIKGKQSELSITDRDINNASRRTPGWEGLSTTRRLAYQAIDGMRLAEATEAGLVVDPTMLQDLDNAEFFNKVRMQVRRMESEPAYVEKLTKQLDMISLQDSYTKALVDLQTQGERLQNAITTYETFGRKNGTPPANARGYEPDWKANIEIAKRDFNKALIAYEHVNAKMQSFCTEATQTNPQIAKK